MGVCARVGVVLITHSLEINSASYAMIDEALSTGCGLLDGKRVGATLDIVGPTTSFCAPSPSQGDAGPRILFHC